ncbi:hypothetical protein L7F22_006963 [Adiantum nelumboides]|nr:hypothetical protein [Adiantum nelumboides]
MVSGNQGNFQGVGHSNLNSGLVTVWIIHSYSIADVSKKLTINPLQLVQTMHCLKSIHALSKAHDHKDEQINPRWIPKAAPLEKKLGEELTLVYVPPHPLVKHWLSVLRNESSSTPVFSNAPSLLFIFMSMNNKLQWTSSNLHAWVRELSHLLLLTPQKSVWFFSVLHNSLWPWLWIGSALAELGRFLIYEAARDWLLTVKGEVQTPCGVAGVEFIDPREPVRVRLRSLFSATSKQHVSSVLPATQTFHIGFVRDEITFQPALYLNKLPDKFPDGVRVLVADPMLATGGTVTATIDLLKERNVDHRLIRVVSAAAAPPALDQLSTKFPGLRIYTATVDEEVTEKGDIVPGIGDAGDRSYGT